MIKRATDGPNEDAPESLQQEVGKRLVEQREAKGIPQGEAADRLGVSAPKLSAYENGKNLPRADKLYQMACLYGTTVEYLMSGHDRTRRPLLASEREEALAFADNMFWIGGQLNLLARRIQQDAGESEQLTRDLGQKAESARVSFSGRRAPVDPADARAVNQELEQEPKPRARPVGKARPQKKGKTA